MVLLLNRLGPKTSYFNNIVKASCIHSLNRSRDAQTSAYIMISCCLKHNVFDKAQIKLVEQQATADLKRYVQAFNKTIVAKKLTLV